MKPLIIISGGQTGVDRAALQIAHTHGITTGGWAPKGWRTDTGPDPSLRELGLIEHASAGYHDRTIANVRLAGVTVLFGDMTSPGCRLTLRACRDWGKQSYVNPSAKQLLEILQRWHVVNFAGNRQRVNPAAAQQCITTLDTALTHYTNGGDTPCTS